MTAREHHAAYLRRQRAEFIRHYKAGKKFGLTRQDARMWGLFYSALMRKHGVTRHAS